MTLLFLVSVFSQRILPQCMSGQSLYSVPVVFHSFVSSLQVFAYRRFWVVIVNKVLTVLCCVDCDSLDRLVPPMPTIPLGGCFLLAAMDLQGNLVCPCDATRFVWNMKTFEDGLCGTF